MNKVLFAYLLGIPVCFGMFFKHEQFVPSIIGAGLWPLMMLVRFGEWINP